jgi:hypothetical protein
LFARSAAADNMGIKNMGLILGFLGFLFLDWVSLCMAYNVHHYSFFVSTFQYASSLFQKTQRPLLHANESLLSLEKVLIVLILFTYVKLPPFLFFVLFFHSLSLKCKFYIVVAAE